MQAAIPLIEVQDLSASYGQVQALKPTSFHIDEGELVTMLGPNGAGKTTLLRALCGLIKANGTIKFRGQDITGGATHLLAGHGIIMVQEGRGLFSQMSVRENLRLGAFSLGGRGSGAVERRLDIVFGLFPRLKERYQQIAGSLSGGEQQMAAIGRALMADPKLLLLDEPSLGLAPLIVKQIFDVIRDLNRKEGLTVFLVEQNAFHALKLAHRGYVMVNGAITMSGTGAELLARPEVRAAYLEGGH